MAIADRFRHPVGDTDKPLSEWVNRNPFAAFYDTGLAGDRDYHTGDDWNWGSGADDRGASVYAVGNGEIVFSGYAGSAWGNVVIIRHELPDGRSDGQDGGYVYSFYGHLQNLTFNVPDRYDPSKYQQIGIDTKIAEIGPFSGGSPHLHFEMRWRENFLNNDWGYIAGATASEARANAIAAGWLDPAEFLAEAATWTPAQSNTVPTANDDTLNVRLREDGTIIIPVAKLLANDRDPDGDQLAMIDLDGDGSGTGWTGNGTAERVGNSIIFRPDAGATTGRFAYAVNDGRTDDSDWAVVTLNFDSSTAGDALSFQPFGVTTSEPIDNFTSLEVFGMSDGGYVRTYFKYHANSLDTDLIVDRFDANGEKLFQTVRLTGDFWENRPADVYELEDGSLEIVTRVILTDTQRIPFKAFTISGQGDLVRTFVVSGESAPEHWNYPAAIEHSDARDIYNVEWVPDYENGNPNNVKLQLRHFATGPSEEDSLKTLTTLDRSVTPGLSNAEAEITELANGKILVTWITYEDETIDNFGYQNNYTVHGRIISGTSLIVENDFTWTEPRIFTLDTVPTADGGFLILGTTRDEDRQYDPTFQSEIAIRSYDATGQAVGSTVFTTAPSGNNSYDPKATLLSTSDILVTWQTWTGSSYEVTTQILTNDPTKLVNTPPTVQNVPSASEPTRKFIEYDTSPYQFDQLFRDADGDELLYSATGLPEGLSIDPTNGRIYGFVLAEPDDYTVKVSASDGRGGTASDSFTFTITDEENTRILEQFDPGTSGLVMMATGALLFTDIDEARTYLGEQYDKGIKYIMSFSGASSAAFKGFSGELKSGFGVDLADLFGITAEGRGGYDSNPNGKVTLWDNLDVTLGKAWSLSKGKGSPFEFPGDANFGVMLTPVKFDALNADAIQSNKVVLGGELSLGGIAKVDVGGGFDFANLSFVGDISTTLDVGPVAATYSVTDGAYGVQFSLRDTFKFGAGGGSTAGLKITGSNTAPHSEIDRDALTTVSLVQALNNIAANEEKLVTFSDGITGDTSSNTLVGGAYDDIIWGGGGNDGLYGGPGNDVLFAEGLRGASGLAVLEGGTGDDILIYGNYGEWDAKGGGDDDTYIIETAVAGNTSAAEGTTFINIEDSGGGHDTIVFVTPNRVDPTADVVVGSIGNGTATIDIKTDKGLILGERNATVYIKGQNTETSKIESIRLAMIEDGKLVPYAKLNHLERLNASDDLLSGNGYSVVAFDADQVMGTPDDDRAVTFTGVGEMNMGDGSDYLTDGMMGRTLSGGDGNDILRGDVGRLLGGADVLIGGKDDDILMGHIGSDTFVFRKGDGHDTIAHFNADDVTHSDAAGYQTTLSGADFELNSDVVRLIGFDGLNSSNIESLITQTADGGKFAYQGDSILFYDIAANDITSDHFEFL